MGLVGLVSSLDWGDVPAWVGGLATAGALVYALAQGRGAREDAAEALAVANREAQWREEIRQDELADHARQLIVTVVTSPTSALFRLSNTGPDPFRAVRLEAAYLSGITAPAKYSWGPSSSLSVSVSEPGSETLISGGDDVVWEVEYRDEDGRILNLTEEMDPTIDVSYVDKRGTRWRRWQNVNPRRDMSSTAIHREPPEPAPRHD